MMLQVRSFFNRSGFGYGMLSLAGRLGVRELLFYCRGAVTLVSITTNSCISGLDIDSTVFHLQSSRH